MNWQFKFFIYWFITFFISMITAMATQNVIAINVVLSLLIVIGVVMLSTTIKDAYLSISSKNWPTTKFTVLKSWVSRRSSPSHTSSTNFSANFDLGYKILSIPYSLPCNTLNIPIHSSIQEAEAYIQEVREGKYGSNVYYNPDNPEQAYVKPGLKFQHVITSTFGLGFVVIPLAFILGYSINS